MDFSQVSKIRLEGKPYDAEVEYLESTGTQYIDTGIAGTGQGYLAVRFQPLPVSDTTVYWRYFGAAAGTKSTTRTIGVWQANPERLAVGFDNGYSASYLGPIGPVYTIDKTQYQVPTGHNGNFLIFTYNNTNNMGPMRLYSFKLWNSNDQLIRDFIPVRKNGVGYLFDKVSGHLFGNQGTDAFLYGSDVRCYSVAKIEQDTLPGKPYDHRVEYIESTGTQYIDTGLYLQSGDTVSMRASCSTDITQCLWSARQIPYPRNTFTLFRIGQSSPPQGRFDYGINNSGDTGVNTPFDFSGWSGVHEYKAVANKFYIDDVLYVTGRTEQFTTAGTARILASESASTLGTITNYFYGKLYNFKVVRNGTTIMDLVPVRKNGVGCLYDLVSKTLFQNVGTGTLSYGSDVPEVLWKKRPYDAEVEYLEVDGTQYVDIPTSGTPNTYYGVSGKAQVLSGIANGKVFFDSNTDKQFLGVSYSEGTGGWTFGSLVGTDAINGDFFVRDTMYNFSVSTTGRMIPDGTISELNRPITAAFTKLRLFAPLGTTGDRTAIDHFRLGSLIITTGSKVEHHLIPVRKNGVGYLYDKVSGQLFGNAGTGVFGYGADLEGSNL